MASPTAPTIVIIGAGTAGLATAIALKTQYNFHDFIIYEKAHDVGGTWRFNVYPGCSSDVPMAFYSLSTDVHDWKHSHGSQEDILEYWVSLATKYDLYKHIRFNRRVVNSEWDDELMKYRITTKRETDAPSEAQASEQDTTTIEAKIVISAIGILEIPRFARIPGLDTFKGPMFHSARWDKSVDLSNKRVAVVGNGASATQFVPIISKDPSTTITQFCRTPHWLFPPIRKRYSNLRRALFKHVPFLNRLLRYTVYLRLEFLYFSIFGYNIFRPIMTGLTKMYMKYAAPKEYHQQLIPNFPLGCKRIIFDTNWLKALHRPNLSLNWSPISRIVPDGIITEQGSHLPFDVLIFATGYAADYYPIPVKGRNGKTIEEYYKEEKGPKAYLGTALPGFPNYFMVFGPNTATGHTSVIFTNECQVSYILQLIKPIIIDNKVKTIEVTPQATDAYNDKIHGMLEKSVFTSCVSWYRVGGVGKVTNAFPGAATTFWRWLRKPNLQHYIGVGWSQWVQEETRRERWALARKIILFSLVRAALVWYFRAPLMAQWEVARGWLVSQAGVGTAGLGAALVEVQKALMALRTKVSLAV